MAQAADLGSMPALLSLPFEVLVNIVVLLPLSDLLKFKETCIYAHDIVLYCCQHLKELNFKSVLTGIYGYISLPDEVILKVLYLFTRVERIYHLALPPSFNSHQELSHYFKTHLIECFGGHPIGQLQFIHIPYPHPHDTSYSAYKQREHNHIISFTHLAKDEFACIHTSSLISVYPLSYAHIWSSFNLDAPWHYSYSDIEHTWYQYPNEY